MEACLPAGSALLRSFSFQGVHFREPICPTHWSAQEFQVQGFLPLGNVLLTYLLSNSPIGSGKPLPFPTFPASETSISSPIHLTGSGSLAAQGMPWRGLDWGGSGSLCSFLSLPVRGQSGEGWQDAGAAGLWVRGAPGYAQPKCLANARNQRSWEWKLKPDPAPPVHSVPLETNQTTLCTGTADLCLVIYPLTTEK